ncbi:MAG: hypothetical protein ACFCUJ_16035 [Thiotrichales bacterium]
MIPRYMSAARRQLSVLKRPYWQTLVLLVVFVLAQTAALIHAEIHPFHEHDESCAVYAAVEHQTPHIGVLNGQLPFIRPQQILLPRMHDSGPWEKPILFWARAPPRLVVLPIQP